MFSKDKLAGVQGAYNRKSVWYWVIKCSATILMASKFHWWFKYDELEWSFLHIINGILVLDINFWLFNIISFWLCMQTVYIYVVFSYSYVNYMYNYKRFWSDRCTCILKMLSLLLTNIKTLKGVHVHLNYFVMLFNIHLNIWWTE